MFRQIASQLLASGDADCRGDRFTLYHLPDTFRRYFILAYIDTQGLSPGEPRMRINFNAINWRKEVYTRNWFRLPFIKN